MTWNLTSFTKQQNRIKRAEEKPEDVRSAGTTVSPDSLSPLDLAFVGDSVFDLLVREDLLRSGSRPVKDLHSMAVARVRAEAQAKAAAKIIPLLTEDETAVFKRGRNAKVGGIPKKATAGEYHTATGLEALFGWLYLKGEGTRITELFDIIREGESNED